MPLESGLFLACGHVPQFELRLLKSSSSPRGQGFAVRAEGHGTHLDRVPLEGGRRLASGYVPQFELTLSSCSASRGQGFAVWANGDRKHPFRVPLEGGLQRWVGSLRLLRRWQQREQGTRQQQAGSACHGRGVHGCPLLVWFVADLPNE